MDAAADVDAAQTDVQFRLPPGRPPSTNRRDLAAVAMKLFMARGFEETSVEQIASAAGVSRRTFFRYFPTKSAVFWNDFDLDIRAIHDLLADAPDDQPMMDAIRVAVITANQYQAAHLPELRARMNLLATVPMLQADATLHYEAWERTIAEFAASRIGAAVNSLWPLLIGRTTLAACRAAFDRWSTGAAGHLTDYLDAALVGLAAGFSPDQLPATPAQRAQPRRQRRR